MRLQHVDVQPRTHTRALAPPPGTCHGPLPDACRPSLVIHGLAGGCGAVPNHWAVESLWVVKAQRVGHALRAAAASGRLCAWLSTQWGASEYALMYIALLLE